MITITFNISGAQVWAHAGPLHAGTRYHVTAIDDIACQHLEMARRYFFTTGNSDAALVELAAQLERWGYAPLSDKERQAVRKIHLAMIELSAV